MFVLTKNYSNRWRAQVSYVWSKAEGTINNGSEGTYGVSNFYASPTMSLPSTATLRCAGTAIVHPATAT